MEIRFFTRNRLPPAQETFIFRTILWFSFIYNNWFNEVLGHRAALNKHNTLNTFYCPLPPTVPPGPKASKDDELMALYTPQIVMATGVWLQSSSAVHPV